MVKKYYSLDKKIRDITKILTHYQKPKCIVLADFDQCIVTNHISRLNTNYFSENFPVDQNKLAFGKSGEGRENIKALCELLIGFRVEIVKNNLKKLMDETELNPNGELFLRICRENRVPIVFVTSGLEWSVEEFCRKYKLRDIFWIGDTFTEKDGLVSGVNRSIGAEDKGYIAKRFREIFKESKIVTVGHSAGDRFLVENGTQGYRINLDNKGGLADYKNNYDRESVGLDWKPVQELIQKTN